MSPADFTRAFTEFWTAQGQVLIKAQEQTGKALAEGMQAMASGGMPGMPSMPTDLSGTAAELARASQSVMELWSAASSMSGLLATKLPAAPGDGVVDEALRKIIDPSNWLAGTGEMDSVLGRMAEGPRFADLWEVERRYARVLQAWMTVRRRGLEHNAVTLDGWLEAGRRFNEAVSGRMEGEAQPLDSKAALALWTETANQQLLATQRSEPFLKTQREMIRASTELRMVQQELVEYFGKQYGFPTRTELDDVHRTVTELRRELRLMRREQRLLAVAVPGAAVEPAPIASVARRSTAKKKRSVR